MPFCSAVVVVVEVVVVHAHHPLPVEEQLILRVDMLFHQKVTQ